MARRHALLVYYSDGGITESVAREVAELGGFDVDSIVNLDPRPRSGVRGIVLSYVDSLSRHRPPIGVLHNPGDYDLVIVGTPVWRGSMASPVRTYLEQHAHEFRKVALFCTTRSRGAWETLREMAALCDPEPEAMLFTTHAEIEARRHREALVRFTNALRPEPNFRDAVAA